MKGPFEELSSVLNVDKLRLWTEKAKKLIMKGEKLWIYIVYKWIKVGYLFF